MFCKNGKIAEFVVKNRDGSPSGLFSVFKDYYNDFELAYKEYLKIFSKIDKPVIKLKDYLEINSNDFTDYIKSLNKDLDIVEKESLINNRLISKSNYLKDTYTNKDYLSNQIIGENSYLILEQIDNIDNFLKRMNNNESSILQIENKLYIFDDDTIYESKYNDVVYKIDSAYFERIKKAWTDGVLKKYTDLSRAEKINKENT